MLSEVMGIGDLGGTQVGIGHQLIDKGGLPHPAVATQERDLSLEQGAQRLDALPL